jgi:hypothetical protein
MRRNLIRTEFAIVARVAQVAKEEKAHSGVTRILERAVRHTQKIGPSRQKAEDAVNELAEVSTADAAEYWKRHSLSCLKWCRNPCQHS